MASNVMDDFEALLSRATDKEKRAMQQCLREKIAPRKPGRPSKQIEAAASWLAYFVLSREPGGMRTVPGAKASGRRAGVAKARRILAEVCGVAESSFSNRLTKGRLELSELTNDERIAAFNLSQDYLTQSQSRHGRFPMKSRGIKK